MTLLGMNEVRKFEGIADEKNRGIVADDVPIAFFGVEAKRKAAYVALGIGGPALAGDRGEAQERFGLLADLRQRGGASVFRDVISYDQRSIGT